MSDVKWIKLNVDMFNDEKIRLIECMPEGDTILVIWVKLLSQAGRTNAKGYIFLNENVPYTIEMLSTLFNRPLATVRLAFTTFQQFGMIEIDENDFICITNWEKHQNVDGMEKIREQTRKRVAEHRKKKKETKLLLEEKKENRCNVTGNDTVTPGNATEEEEELELEEDKEISSTTTANVNAFSFYENNFGQLSPYLIERLNKWLEDFSDNHEIVVEALKISVERNKKSLAYAETMLIEWFDKNAKTLSDVKAIQLEGKPKVNIGTHKKQNGGTTNGRAKAGNGKSNKSEPSANRFSL